MVHFIFFPKRALPPADLFSAGRPRFTFAGFGPRFSVPREMSQFGCLQLGQRTGLPGTRLTQTYVHRTHLQTCSSENAIAHNHSINKP